MLKQAIAGTFTEDKNIFVTFNCYGYKLVVLGRGYLSQHVLESF